MAGAASDAGVAEVEVEEGVSERGVGSGDCATDDADCRRENWALEAAGARTAAGGSAHASRRPTSRPGSAYLRRWARPERVVTSSSRSAGDKTWKRYGESLEYWSRHCAACAPVREMERTSVNRCCANRHEACGSGDAGSYAASSADAWRIEVPERTMVCAWDAPVPAAMPRTAKDSVSDGAGAEAVRGAPERAAWAAEERTWRSFWRY
jgi:hypothetical protein